MSENQLLNLVNDSSIRLYSIEAISPELYSQNIDLSYNDLKGHFDSAQDSNVKVYAGVVLAVKIEQECPIGTICKEILREIFVTINSNRPEILPLISPCFDSIVSTEIIKSEDQDIWVWIETVCFLKEFSEPVQSLRAINIQFTFIVWAKITEICNDPSGMLIYETLELMDKAKSANLGLESDAELVISTALDFIEERNDVDLNQDRGIPTNIQEDFKIIDKIKKLGSFPEEFKKKIRDLETMLSKVEPRQKVIKDPDYAKNLIYGIDLPALKITEKSIYANRGEHFQVAIHRGIYGPYDVAIKMYKLLNPNASFDKVNTEIKCYQCLSLLADPNRNCFIKYYGSYLENNEMNLVMEYYDKNLMSVITEKKNSNNPFSEIQVVKMFYQLVRSFAEMESKNIFHGDIKPHNLMSDQFYNIKIIDFSIAVFKNEDLTDSATGMNPIQGTKGYCAPEIAKCLKENQKIGSYNPSKADVFSLGLVFLQVLTLQSFEDDLNTFEKNSVLLGLVNRLQFGWARDLLGAMLKANHRERPLFKNCLTYLKPVLTKTISQSHAN